MLSFCLGNKKPARRRVLYVKRSIKLPLLRVLVWCKWGVVYLLWMALFDYFIHPWPAGLLACIMTVDMYWDPKNWKEHQLMKQPTINLYLRRKNSSV